MYKIATAMGALIVGVVALVASNVSRGDETQQQPGWLDDATLTDADWARVAEITKRNGFSSNLSVIRSLQSGFQSGITRRDFELLRQDRRRGRAAYPEIGADELTEGVWLSVPLSAGIPASWGGGNSNSTRVNGKWILDGGDYQSVMKAQYPKRATPEETRAFFVTLKANQRAEKIARLKEDGPMTWISGTGGSFSVELRKETNEIVMEEAEEWAATATRWTFPFVLEEWIDISESDRTAIKKLPSFATATKETITVTPSGTRISSGAPTQDTP